MSDEIETRIVAHHVGARGFGVALNCPKAFDADVVHVLYEADAECAAQMRADNDDDRYFVLPYCLGAKKKTGTLHVTANPYGSSLYAPNDYYRNYYGEVYPDDRVYDAIFGEWCRTVREVEVEIESLDNLFEQGRLPITAPPDFLSLDTQGSEFDILTGARHSIARGVLGLATEIEFHPIYRGQPLFSDILKLAESYGFHFAGFLHTADHISPFRAPLGQRGNAFLAFGDALFLRRAETLKDMARNQLHLYVMTQKLAFISILFGYVEYGISLFDEARTIIPYEKVPADIGERAYHKFLYAFRSAMLRMDQVYLNTRLDREKSPTVELPVDKFANSRFVQWKRRTIDALAHEYRVYYLALNRHVDSLPHRRIRHLVFTRPHEAALRAFCYLLRYIDNKVHGYTQKSPFTQLTTLAEEVLNQYDMHWLIAVLRQRRMRAAQAAINKADAYTVTAGLE